MPSPFPGMDPYLEHPEFFGGLHDRLIAELSAALQQRLPDAYYADIGSRVWIEYSERIVEPDVNVLRPDRPTTGGSSGTGGGSTAVAVCVQPVVVYVPAEERREPFLEIRTVQGEHRLVTAIEVLSRTNKTPGERGRGLYLDKQRECLGSQVNLVEIDLLRDYTHSTAVPRDLALAQTGPFAYHACVHRYDDPQHFYVYPIRLEQRLPEIAIPLLPADPAVVIDLQAVFDRCYDTGPYRRLRLYETIQPIPPLSTEQAAWANQLLTEKGFRTSESR